MERVAAEEGHRCTLAAVLCEATAQNEMAAVARQ